MMQRRDVPNNFSSSCKSSSTCLAWLAFVACIASSILAPAVEHERICRCRNTDDRLLALPLGINLEGTGPRYAPDREVDILHIKINVTPDFKQRTVKGTTTITFTPISKPLKTLYLDAVNLSISEVKSGEAISDFVSTEHDLSIVFKQPIPVGKKAAVSIQHSAEPKAGLYFRTPEMGYPETDTHLWTQGETHEARHWFPCFDYPNERSSTEVICHVPKDMTVLSNGEKLSEKVDDQSGLKSVHWLQTKPHVNYLICLVAGHFEKLEKKHRDLELGFYVQPSLAAHAENSFADTDKIMEFFEKEIGVPFPWKKYDQVTIRDFVAGGMENTSLTTLYHGTIFSKATENLRTTRRLDAHEMAHQWFGDYVTCKDWSHIWLNEGFATYYTHLFEGDQFGQDAMNYGLYLDASERVLSERKKHLPIVYKGYKNPMQQFDYRAYPKGSWVLHMLRCQLGPELFRDCIKTYLETHALTAVVTDELRQIIEAKSGRTFDRFFDQWLYHGRHPDLKIDYRWLPETKLAKVTIAQTQKVDNDTLLFHVPAKLRFHVENQAIDHDIQINRNKQEFYIALPAQPEIVRFDPEFTILANITFKKPDKLLSSQLKNEKDMMGRLLAVKALGDRKTQKSVELLAEALKSDPFFGVRIQAAKSLRKIDNDQSFAALRAAFEKDSLSDAKVRLEVVKGLTKKHRDESREVIKTIFESEKNPEIRAEAVKALGRYSDAESKAMVLLALKTNTFRNELINAALTAIRQQKDPAFQQSVIETVQDVIHPWETNSVKQGLSTLATISSDTDDKSEIRQFLISFLDAPKDQVQAAALDALGILADPQTSALIESFIVADKPDDRVIRAARSALGKVNQQSPLAPQELIELRDSIRNLKSDNEKLRNDLDDLKKQVKSTTSASDKNSTPEE